MDQITDGVNSISVADSSIKKNRIQVSNTKKPLFFYVNLAKDFRLSGIHGSIAILGIQILPLRFSGYLGLRFIDENVGFLQRYMQQHDEVELSALGMAIATVVTITEILKSNGLVVEKKITTSTVDMNESGGRPVQKAKIEIVLGKSEKFDELMAAAAAAAEARDEEEEEQA